MRGGVDEAAVLLADDAGRHRVTVLFADIHASTRMIQHLDAEAAADIMEPALQSMIEEVERHGGVPASRGDGIMAIFGAPSICEDHALRACLSAVAIRDRLASGTPALRPRIGINTGEVVISRYRIGDAAMPQATGIAVHVAARLEQTAKPGLIAISQTTLELTRGFVRVRALRPMVAKGVDLPVARAELLDVDASADQWSVRAAKGLGRMVDREVETAMLAAMLVRGEPTGPRIVQVLGSAGMGKSRLLHEFITGPAVTGRAVVRFAADRYRRLLAFHPIAEWLREAMGIGPVCDRADGRARIAAGLAALDVTTPDAAVLVERLLGLYDARPGDTQTVHSAQRLDAFAAVAAIMRAQARGRPIVVACDDIDHFDPVTLELLAALLRLLDETRLLVVATCRAAATLPPTVAVRTVELGPLSRKDVLDVLTGVAPALAGNPLLADEIVRKSGGNPLFVEEVASLVLGRAPIKPDAAPDATAEPPAAGDGAIAIPDRVQALIADHLTCLPAELRRMIRLCAVVGLDVPVRLLAVLSGLDEPAVARQLAQLDDEHLLQQTRLYPAPQYSFRHALVRDVVYAAMLTTQRRAIHAAVLHAMEADREPSRGGQWSDQRVDQRGDQRVYDLAHHAVAARMWQPAFDYLRQAGRGAVDKFAYQEAYAQFSRAQDIARELPESVSLARDRLAVALDIRLLLLELDRYEELEPLLQEAEATAEGLNDATSHVRVVGWRAHVAAVLGRLDEAAGHGARAHGLARALGDPTLVTASAHYLGQAQFYLGALREADALLESVEAPAVAVSAGRGVAVGGSMPVLVRGTRSLALSYLGRFAVADAVLAVARQFAEMTRRPYDSAFICSVELFLNVQRERNDASAVAVEDGLALAEEYGLTQLVLPLRIGQGHVEVMRGDHDAAARTLEAALADAQARRRHFLQINAGLALAGAELGRGNKAASEERAAEALVVADSFGFRALKVVALRRLGLAMLARETRRGAGRHLLRSARALALELGMVPELARCHEALHAAGGADAGAHRAEADRLRADLTVA